MPYAAVAINVAGWGVESQIMEIAIAIVNRDNPRSQIVLDTLICPDGELESERYHGVTAAQLRDAPRFADIAEAILAAFANRVVAAHQSSFVLDTLSAHFRRCGMEFMTPHLCTLRLEGLIAHEDGGPVDRSLEALATYLKIPPPASKSASDKAMCVGLALRKYLVRMKEGTWRTFADLGGSLDEASFVGSFEADPVPMPQTFAADRRLLRPRTDAPRGPQSTQRQYLELVLAVVADLQVDQAELDAVVRAKHDLGLSVSEVRAVHARVFAGALQRYNEDNELDLYETENLFRLAAALRRLGWVPGDPPNLGEGHS